MTKIGVLTAAALAAGALAAPANATTNPQANVTLDCRSRLVLVEFHYSGFNPANQHLVAHERVTGGAYGSRTHTLILDAEGDDTSYLRLGLLRQQAVTASTEVTAANGRVKASATATIHCATPPPPPPDVEATSARLIGPCGDPMYAAVFNNRRGTTAVWFRWRYHSFNTGQYQWLVRKVRAGQVYRTGYRHVTGSTMTSVRAHGDVLLSERTAPPGNYRPCP